MAVIQERASPSSKTLTTHISVFLVFGLMGVILYGHTLQVPLYLDDFINIRDNLYAIRSLSPRELINASFEGFANHRPLANLSFSLNYYFHGLQLPGYHMVNIVIHVLNGALLYLFIFKTITLPAQRNASHHPVWVATLASLLWFVNPMQIQSVTYIVQRMTSMATLFFLSSFLCYLYGRLSRKKRGCISLFALSAVFWILSMASKQISVTLPVLVFMYEWFFFQDLDKVWLKRAGFFLVTGLGGLLAAVYLVYHYSPLTFVTTISHLRQYTAFERFLTQGRVIFFYISLLLYPHPARLTLNHDVSVSHSLLDPFTTSLSFAGLIVLFALTILIVRGHRLVAFSIIWFFANLAIEALAASTELMFEHRVYLPSMLFFLPPVWALFNRLNKPKIVSSILGLLIIILGFWTYQRNGLWNDPVTFWEDAVRKSPNHYRSNGNLGIAYLHARAYDEAIVAFRKTLTLHPPYPTEIYTNMGMLYLEIGQRDLARHELAQALEINPDNYLALNGLGILEQKEQNYGKALKHYLMAIKMNGNFASSHYNLGMLYMDMGDLNNAVKTFMRALELRPMWSEAYSSLGLAWARQGRYDLAIPALQKAISIQAGNQEALFNLAKVYNLSGRHTMAARTYKTLIEMHPEDVEAMHNLALIYLNHLKNVEQAKLYFSKALAVDPEYDQAAIARDILSQTAVRP